MAYPVYATTEQLATYLGMPEESLPSDSLRMLTRASELVQQATMGNVDSANADHLEAAQLATCAQVEYWMGSGEDVSKNGNFSSLSIGSFSVNYGSSVGSDRQFSPRARNYLMHAGLLYRGVKSSARSGLPLD